MTARRFRWIDTAGASYGYLDGTLRWKVDRVDRGVWHLKLNVGDPDWPTWSTIRNDDDWISFTNRTDAKRRAREEMAR